MKKLFLFGATVALAMGFGCAITNYALITDNDVGGTVNTNGKAYIRQSSQIATIQPDGTDNLMWFVDQKANGDRVLTTYNFHRSGSESPFKDDLYCSPDWTGCAVNTSQDPQTGDTSIFDYKANFNCSGARSLSLLISTSRYYGECGRAKADRMTTALSLANQMTPVQMNGSTWLKGTLDSTNATWVLDNHNGATAAFSPAGSINVFVNAPLRRVQIDMSNPVLRQSLLQVNSWLTSHPGPSLTVTRVINGISMSSQEKILTAALGVYIQEKY